MEIVERKKPIVATKEKPLEELAGVECRVERVYLLPASTDTDQPVMWAQRLNGFCSMTS